MMTKNFNFSLKKLFLYIIIFSLFIQSAFSSQEEVWTVGAEKFSFVKGQTENNLTDGIAVTIPKSILENLNQVLVRNINIDEKLSRKSYELRQKRQSLYLQLSNEYKKRDSLFLSYSDNKLKKKLQEQEKEIDKIKKQIDENLSEFKNAEVEMRKKAEEETHTTKNFFKSIISNEESVFTSEKIKLYNNDPESLIEVSERAAELGYNSPLFEKEICDKNINGFLTGDITGYGDYISVAVDFYLYPSGRKIGTVMEIGSLNDLEFIASSIVSQLIPLMTNSMPVSLKFEINPKEAVGAVEIYIDDVLQKNHHNGLTINAGVHSFKIAAKGYKSLATNYHFDGNTKYNVQVNLEAKNEGSMFVNLKKPLVGQLYVNGVLGEPFDDSKTKITINGNKVLGQFIAEDGNTSFFYIPEKLYYDENNVIINPKPIDRGEKIEKRRRWMYGAYSGFMVSLIPLFITRGYFDNIAEQYYAGNVDYDTAHKWEITTNVFAGLTIGAGIFWGFELVRYLLAANSVLPEKAKQVHLMDLENSELEKEENTEKENVKSAVGENHIAEDGDKQ